MWNQPDIILLVLDTQRLDRLSCYGYEAETTPHLDRFANQGTRFRQAISTAQWTIPTHASIFTGLYPSQHTLHQMDGILPSEIVTVAERLRKSGYFTAGYSHNPLVGAVPNGLQRGFIDFENYHLPEAGLLSFQFDRQKKARTLGAKIRHAGRFSLAEVSGYSHQSILQNLSVIGEPAWRAFLELRGQSKDMQVATSLRNAARLLIERPGLQPDQPVFVFINLMGTHVPYDPPDWAVDRFLPGKIGRREARQLLQHVNGWQVDVRNWLDMFMLSDENLVVLNAFYDAEVAEQDAQIGNFFKRLEKGGVFDRTLIIVTADHGDHLGDKQRLNHAFGVYDALVHVPLIIVDPKGEVPRSTVSQEVVSTRRIYHTILTSAGIASADEEALSFVNQASDLVVAEGYPLMWAVERLERYRPGLIRDSGQDKLVRAVYTKGYKLITTGDKSELYNLREDQLEAFDRSQEETEWMQALGEDLKTFSVEMQPMAVENLHHDIEDEIILAQLRNLGYLE